VKTPLRALAAIGPCVVMACSTPQAPPTPTDLKPEHASASVIPISPVAGTVSRAPFTLGDARVEIDRRPGNEKLTIRLSNTRSSRPCAPLPVEGTSTIWIRFPGKTTLAPGEWRRIPGQVSEPEVHLQVNDSGQWTGTAESAAVLGIQSADPAVQLEGALSVCFADAARSCVAGGFVATVCPNVLDDSPRTFSDTSREEREALKARLADAGAPDARSP